MRAALLAALLLLPGIATALPADSLESPGQSWLIDHTRSDLGGEFYRAFASAWRREARGDLVISVEERMAQPFAHQVTVWAGQRQLAVARLYPARRDEIPQLAERAVAAATSRLAAWASPGATP